MSAEPIVRRIVEEWAAIAPDTDILCSALRVGDGPLILELSYRYNDDDALSHIERIGYVPLEFGMWLSMRALPVVIETTLLSPPRIGDDQVAAVAKREIEGVGLVTVVGIEGVGVATGAWVVVTWGEDSTLVLPLGSADRLRTVLNTVIEQAFTLEAATAQAVHQRLQDVGLVERALAEGTAHQPLPEVVS